MGWGEGGQYLLWGPADALHEKNPEDFDLEWYIKPYYNRENFLTNHNLAM